MSVKISLGITMATDITHCKQNNSTERQRQTTYHITIIQRIRVMAYEVSNKTNKEQEIFNSLAGQKCYNIHYTTKLQLQADSICTTQLATTNKVMALLYLEVKVSYKTFDKHAY